MNPNQSQQLESFVPVYDTVPFKWEDAREFLVEHLKKISNALNIREIGWFLDEELLAGKTLFPGTFDPGNSSPRQNRQILRWVIDSGAISVGANVIPHSILFDVNFTLTDLWVAATNSTTFVAQVITGDSVIMNATTIDVTSTRAYDRSITVVEYTQEQ